MHTHTIAINTVNRSQIRTHTHTLCALANGAAGGHGRGGGVSPPLVCIDINLRCDSFLEGGEKRCTVGFNLAQFLVCRLLYRQCICRAYTVFLCFCVQYKWGKSCGSICPLQ